MGIHDGHRARKKEYYRLHGLHGMADHEVLELLLYYAIPRRDTNEIAHRLITEFGSLNGVLAAPPEALTQVPGVGAHAAAMLRLIYDINSRQAICRSKDVHLDTVRACGHYALRLLDNERTEKLYQLCIDDKGKLIENYLLSAGAMDAASVSVRRVVGNAIACGCNTVVLAHNHPGGIALPSEADRQTTAVLQKALAGVEIALTDHVIVADGDYVSMAESGYIK